MEKFNSRRYEEYKRSFWTSRRYAGYQLSRGDIVMINDEGEIISISHALDQVFIDIFKQFQDSFSRDSRYFSVVDGNLMDSIQQVYYIRCFIIRSHWNGSHYMYVLSYVVTDDFYKFLIEQDSWIGLADGVLEQELRDVLSEA